MMADKIIIFSEEYIKITKGMFVIWMNHPCEASKRRQVDILLNHEHWALDEAKEVCQANAVNVKYFSYPYGKDLSQERGKDISHP
jgi:hypothetical protein